MNYDWRMMKDDWRMMKDDWRMNNEEWWFHAIKGFDYRQSHDVA